MEFQKTCLTATATMLTLPQYNHQQLQDGQATSHHNQMLVNEHRNNPYERSNDDRGQRQTMTGPVVASDDGYLLAIATSTHGHGRWRWQGRITFSHLALLYTDAVQPRTQQTTIRCGFAKLTMNLHIPHRSKLFASTCSPLAPIHTNGRKG